MDKRLVSIALGGCGLMLGLLSQPVQAALPDQDTYDFVMRRYDTLLTETRSGCGYYANLSTLVVEAETRSLSVLMTLGPSGGTACNGVFEFQVLSVRCDSQEISYSQRLASPANWQESWQQNPQVAELICAIEP